MVIFNGLVGMTLHERNNHSPLHNNLKFVGSTVFKEISSGIMLGTMTQRLLLCLLFCIVFVTPVYAVRSLPPGVQPKSIEGEAKGTFPKLGGSGTLTFINTGGEAKLTTVCDEIPENGANSATCTGIDVAGSFTGGPDGTAIFKTPGGEIKLQLNAGKVFTFSSQVLSMDFNVTDPSIFDAWVENTGARDSGARISNIDGQLEIACPPDLEAWDVMKKGRVIYVDCHLKTGEDSKAVISFSDMTSFEMKPETEIVIDTPPEKESKWSLLMGNIWVNVKQMVKDGTMKVHMSQAVAGIKGTRFILTENGKESKIEVTEGKVEFTHNITKENIFVSPGESVTADSVGFKQKVTFDPSSLDAEILGFKSEKQPIKTSYLIIIAGVILAIIIIGFGIGKKRKK